MKAGGKLAWYILCFSSFFIDFKLLFYLFKSKISLLSIPHLILFKLGRPFIIKKIKGDFFSVGWVIFSLADLGNYNSSTGSLMFHINPFLAGDAFDKFCLDLFE